MISVYTGATARWNAVRAVAGLTPAQLRCLANVQEHQELELRPTASWERLSDLGFVLIGDADLWTKKASIRSSMFGEEPVILWETIGCPKLKDFPDLTDRQLDMLVYAIESTVPGTKLEAALARRWPKRPRSRQLVLNYLGVRT